MITEAISTVGSEEGFRRWAEVYDSAPNPLLALEERLLQPLVGDVFGRTVVDVGCGTGRWLSRLGNAFMLVGIDSSREMLERARKRVDERALLLTSSATSIPLRAGLADTVLCSLTLGYIENIDLLAREIQRISRPDADIFITDFHPEAHQRGWRRTFRCDGLQIEIRNFTRSLREICEAFRSAGLDTTEIIEPSFGEPERQFFIDAGKSSLFSTVAQEPAIFIARLRPKRIVRTSTRNAGDLVLSRARVAVSGETATQQELCLVSGRIADHRSPSSHVVSLEGLLLLPGLVNAHDHLEFNLFPRLGRGPYPNFLAWANDIHEADAGPIRIHCDIDRRTRLYWGAIKNLCSGVTTVAHHNPYDTDVFDAAAFPVRVLKNYSWAHSLALENDVRAAFERTTAGAPFFLHLAEGTDDMSAAEFDALDAAGMLGAATVLVHGVGLTAAQRERLRGFSASLVWCPSSNLFTLGRTLTAGMLQECGRVALGSDSALTAAGDLLDEIRLARDLGTHAAEIYHMVTTTAAGILRLQDGQGTLEPGAIADVIGVRDHGVSPADSVCRLTLSDIELVLISSQVRLISPELASRWPVPLPDLESIDVGGVRRLIAAPVPQLLESVRRHLGPDIRLGHKPVSQ